MKSAGRFVQTLSSAAVAMAATFGFTAGQASAGDINSAVNTAARIIGPGVLAVLDVNGSAAGTDLVVFTPGAAELAVFFNAECSVDSLSDGTYLAIDILVDGVLIPPTGIDRAFCTGTGDNALQHWVSAEANVYRVVPAGNHLVRVRAQLVAEGAGDNGRIDDTSLLVIENP